MYLINGAVMNKLYLIFTVGVIVIEAQDILFEDDYEIVPRFAELPTPKQPVGIDEFRISNGLFTADLYRELSRINKGNFLICPFSLQVMLCLAHAGASLNTAKEIADALHLPDNTEQIQKMISQLPLNKDSPYTLTSVNKVYLAPRFRINQNFRRIVQDVFKADIENIEFNKNKEAAATMNKWVAEKTNNTIKDLISKDYLDGYTLSVMINALYFNANWLNRFDSMLTRPSSFFINKNTEVKVMMMHTRYDFNSYRNEKLDARILELPYEGEEMSLLIVLPNKIDGLSKLEANIHRIIEEQPFNTSVSDISISLPKFKMETSITLQEVLENLGIKDAFTNKSNFRRMTITDQIIYISHAVQKTFIQVTEKGTTAGAATAIINSDRSFGEVFSANHPFIYMLRHKTIGIVFIGKFSNPEGTEVD